MNRRQFTLGSSTIVAAAWLPAAALAADKDGERPTWKPYEKAISIDGLGGLGRLDGNGEPPFTEAEIDDARQSGLTAVRLSLAPSGAFWFNDAAFRLTLDTISAWDQQIIARPDAFVLVLKGADLLRAQRERKCGVIYGFQETAPLGEDLDRVEMFHKRGVRVIQLTHNRRNLVGDGCMEPGDAGLSTYGYKVIEALEHHKIVVDLSHAGLSQFSGPSGRSVGALTEVRGTPWSVWVEFPQGLILAPARACPNVVCA